MVKKRTKHQDQLQIALKEDAVRAQILLGSDDCRADMLGQLLAEADLEDPYWSAASAVAVCLAKPQALNRLASFRSIADYKSITLIPKYGEIPIDRFTNKRVTLIKRKIRTALKRYRICKSRPGLFAFDFEYDSSRRMMIVHIHGLIHPKDLSRSERLSDLREFKSRQSCKYPMHRGRKDHPNGIEGFADYMVKSYWTDRPSYPSSNSKYLKRGQARRIPNPEFAMFLLEIGGLSPGDLIFRMGGGSGRH